MKALITATLVLVLVGLVYAGRSQGAFATVTYTNPDPTIPPFVDSGFVVEDHQHASTFEGYTYRFVVFTDHVDEFHLDGKGGRVDIVYR